MQLRRASLVLVSLAFAAPIASQSTITVDAAGSGDFSVLQEAIDAAAPNDVLRILPGEYAASVMNKRLRLLGDTSAGGLPPRIARLDVLNASSFTLVNLRMRRLVVVGSSGRSEVDRCEIGPTFLPAAVSFSVEGATDLLISRSMIEGSVNNTSVSGHDALAIASSHVQLVDSLVQGANVHASHSQALSGYGGNAISLVGFSKLLVTGSDVIGGFGEDYWILLGPFEAGRGGDAIRVHSLATDTLVQVDMRGNSGHELRGGLGNASQSNTYDGWAFWSTGGNCAAGQLLHDGVSVVGEASCVDEHPTVRPRLSLVGAGGPGAPVSLELYGREDAAGLLAVALAPAILGTPLVATTPLFLDPATVLLIKPLVLHGASAGAVLPLVQPLDTALIGMRVHAQGFQTPPSSPFVGSNAQTIVLGF